MNRTIRAGAVLAACLGTLSLGACGGDSNEPEQPAQGTLAFVLDAVTCTGSGTIELFVDGTSQGVYTYFPGNQRSFVVIAGSHTAGAREIGGGGYVWPTQSVFVPENTTYNLTMTC